MASVFERIDTRAAFPVDINGQVIHVCEPTFGEIDRIGAMAPKDKNGFDGRTGLTLALCIVTADGSKAFPAAESESDESLARRVTEETKRLTPSALRAITDAIHKLIAPVDSVELAKN